jgi:hypothetical protein
VIGAVLQNRLAAELTSGAATASAQLPAPFRKGFASGFAVAAKQGLQIGRGQNGGFRLPAGITPQQSRQLTLLVHDVFVNGYVAAMRPTVLVAVAVLALASASCLLVAGRRSLPVAEPIDAPQAEAAA